MDMDMDIYEITEEYDLYDTLQTLEDHKVCYMDYYKNNIWYFYIIDRDSKGNCNKYIFEIMNNQVEYNAIIKPQMTVKELRDILSVFTCDYE
jgi:uncharacterized protein YeeX (DUF496 family)